MIDELQTLVERRNYLLGRVALKQSQGWEFTYDQRECSALTWAIEQLKQVEEWRTQN